MKLKQFQRLALNVAITITGAAMLCCAVVGTVAAAVPLAPSPTKPSSVTTGRPEPVPIAFVYRDTVNGSAWTLSHEAGRKAVEAEFGARVSTIAVENVATASDADRVFAELLARGYKVIFATDPVHSKAALKAATTDYDIKVEQLLGTQSLINLRVYTIRHHEQAYLAGVIAAGSSTRLKLGFVASMPSPETMAEVNAFTLGAQSVNPRATTQLVWTGSRADVAAETRAAETLIRRGVDVMIATTDSGVALRVAAQYRPRKIGVMGWHAMPKTTTEDAAIATVALDWAPFYKTAVKESFSYLCTKTDTSRGYADGAIKVVGMSKPLPRAAQRRLQAVQSGLEKGDFQVFIGPIHASVGQPVLPARAVGDDAWRVSMNFLVRGVAVVNAGDSGRSGRAR